MTVLAQGWMCTSPLRTLAQGASGPSVAACSYRLVVRLGLRLDGWGAGVNVDGREDAARIDPARAVAGPDLGPDPVPRTVVPQLVLRTGHSAGARVPAADPLADVSPGGLRDRAIGSVVAAAVGDALGAPFEFAPAGTFSARLPHRRPDGEGDMIGGGAFDWAPGEFTDDTQMGLALAVSLIRCDGYDPMTCGDVGAHGPARRAMWAAPPARRSSTATGARSLTRARRRRPRTAR